MNEATATEQITDKNALSAFQESDRHSFRPGKNGINSQAKKDVNSKQSTTPALPLPQGLTPQQIDLLLKEAQVMPGEDIKQPAKCLQVVENNIAATVCTQGNFSLAIGKAKSRKSFLVALLFSIVTGHKNNKFIGTLPEGKGMGIYFDTEQSRYHVWTALKRICRLIEIDEPKNIQIYSLRKHHPAVRRQMIEHVIYNNPQIGFVVIDGIRDLVSSINDEEQATAISTDLLKWTQERDIHIMTILHQNKGDNNARGHLGSELVNKAETVLSITKNEEDKSISIVEAEQCRDMDFNPFAFNISIEALPQIVEQWEQKTTKSKEKQGIIQELGDMNIYKLLTESFSKCEKLLYGQLQAQIKLAAPATLQKSISDNKIIEIMTYAKNKGWAIQAVGSKFYELGQMAA